MKFLLRNIISVFVLIAFLAFSSGLKINYHFCSASNTKLLSLYTEIECHHDKKHDTNCCEHEHENTCSMDDKSCCEDDSQFLKIADPYSFEYEKNKIDVPTLDVAFLAATDSQNRYKRKASIHSFADPPPPLPYGKNLLFLNCTLLL